MKRSTWVELHEEIELRRTGLSCRGYGKNGRFVCRVEISPGGVEVYAGRRGQRRIADLTWEDFVKRVGG